MFSLNKFSIIICILTNREKTVVSMKWSEVKVAQLCPTLCDPMDYTINGILQVRILERVAIPSSKGSSQPRDWTQVSCIARGFFTSWATREAWCPSKKRRSGHKGGRRSEDSRRRPSVGQGKSLSRNQACSHFDLELRLPAPRDNKHV